jgi:hypothetical protein
VDAGENNVFGKAVSKADSASIKYVGTFATLAECRQGLAASEKGPFRSFTFHDPQGDFGVFDGQCFGVTSPFWAPQAQAFATSGQWVAAADVWRYC